MKKFNTTSAYKVIQYSVFKDTVPELFFENATQHEQKEFDIIQANSEKEVIDIILNNPQVDAVVTYADADYEFKTLDKELSFEYKRKWYKYNDIKNHGTELLVAMTQCMTINFDAPFFSIVTPLYNTNEEYFKRALNSLQTQLFKDWEWVLLDDSPKQLTNIKKIIKEARDMRVKYFRITPVSDGCIGRAKYRANCLSRGKWLIEFDHDDILPYWSLNETFNAISKYPDCGFVYSDDIPITGDDKLRGYTYGDEYGLGYAYPYICKDPGGQIDMVTNRNPNINSATMRHIVGTPNHLRGWRRDIYFKVGGHDRYMRIADDYELIVKTFLETKFVHVNAPCYMQRFDGNNSQDTSTNRSDIQRRVRMLSNIYNTAIHKKAEEYGFNEEKFVPLDSFKTMHNYYGIEEMPIYNEVYKPDWNKYEYKETAQEANKLLKAMIQEKQEEKKQLETLQEKINKRNRARKNRKS